MTLHRHIRRRKGVVLAEAGIVYSVAILLVMGTIVIGLGIFRYQQIAWLAREGARWASVHGASYQSENSQSAPTASSVLSNAVTPRMVSLDSTQLTPSLTMTSSTVTFTLTYNWVPEMFLTTLTFTSTSTQAVTY